MKERCSSKGYASGSIVRRVILRNGYFYPRMNFVFSKYNRL
jgi:hypothetical protein